MRFVPLGVGAWLCGSIMQSYFDEQLCKGCKILESTLLLSTFQLLTTAIALTAMRSYPHTREIFLAQPSSDTSIPLPATTHSHKSLGYFAGGCGDRRFLWRASNHSGSAGTLSPFPLNGTNVQWGDPLIYCYRPHATAQLSPPQESTRNPHRRTPRRKTFYLSRVFCFFYTIPLSTATAGLILYGGCAC